MTYDKISIAEKYALTISEASLYFGIGEKKLRSLALEHEGESDSFILKNGCKVLFKRAKFAQFLDRTGSI